ncbi:MAG: arylsulfatase [Gemmataceae bacterium]
MAGALMLALALSLPFAADSPNVLLILTDDQGYGDLSCHGNRILKTPYLDALHAQSVRFTDFHVDPTCSPTRAALLTGRYSSRTGVWHTIAGRSILRRDETTVAQHFQAAGYRTGIFGKWHLGESWPYRPQDRGFEVSLIHGGGGIGQTPDAWGNRYVDDRYWRDGRLEPQKGYCTAVFCRAAERFMVEAKQPFFCYLATNVPHSPYIAPTGTEAVFLKQGVPPARAAFYAMIADLDSELGRLLAALKKAGKQDNTIVIFLTDNGTAAGWNEAKKDGFNAGMRGAKGTVYEGGHRVPCFWCWPGRWKPRDVAGLSMHCDVLPTLLDVCGIAAKHRLPLDGLSLRGVLEGKKALPDRTLFVHSQRVDTPVKGRQYAVMQGPWRMVEGRELYHLGEDPGQRDNRAAKEPKRLQSMRAAYDRWWESISTRFHEVVPLVIGATEQNPVTLTCHDWRGEVVPWNQSLIRTMPWANGSWAIEVAQAGIYRFTLRHQPAEAHKLLEANRAVVRVGDKEATTQIKAGSISATLEMRLEAGAARLQTRLESPQGVRGAFFVEVERLK